MTDTQEILEAVSAAVGKLGEWKTFRRWRAKADELTFTVEHPEGEGHLVHAALGSAYEEIGRGETTRSYRRKTLEETAARIAEILGAKC